MIVKLGVDGFGEVNDEFNERVLKISSDYIRNEMLEYKDSYAFFENKIYVCSNRFDDMALRLKYANINPTLIIMDGSLRNALQCCYWELEKNENMLVLTTPSLVESVYDIFKK